MNDSSADASAAPVARGTRPVPTLRFSSRWGRSAAVISLLIVLMLAADLAFTSPTHFRQALQKPEIQYAVRLTLVTCTISALLSLLVATPLGYLLSRVRLSRPLARSTRPSTFRSCCRRWSSGLAC